MKRLWMFLRYFLSAQKRWQWPKQSEVLIYDAAGEDVLLEHLGQWSHVVLHIRGEQINVPVVLASLFRRGRRLDAYVDAFVARVRPRLVVTFTDNDPRFYSLTTRHRGIRTLFIQNGSRGYHDVFGALDGVNQSTEFLKVNCMMTFGERIGAEYAKYVSGTVVAMGSLKNNMAPRAKATKPGTIAFISQYRNTAGVAVGDRIVTRHEFFEQTDQAILPFLSTYAKDRGKSLVIIPCAHLASEKEQREEQQYYANLLGQAAESCVDMGQFASYDAVDAAEVVVGIDSTLAYESAARGNKTAFFSVRGHFLGFPRAGYGWPEIYPDEGPFWTSRPDLAAFERILDHLFGISAEQWRAELLTQKFSSIIAYDPGNTILKATLRRELAPAPIRQQDFRPAIDTPKSVNP